MKTLSKFALFTLILLSCSIIHAQPPATSFGFTSTNYTDISGTGTVRNVTPFGYLEFGPNSTSFCQFNTDRPRFYFNAPLYVNNGRLVSYGGANIHLCTSDATVTSAANIRLTANATTGFIGIGIISPAAPLQVKGDIMLGNTNTGSRWLLHTQDWMTNGEFHIVPDNATGNSDFTKGIRIGRTGTTVINTGQNYSSVAIGHTGNSSALSYGTGYLGFNMMRNASNSNWELKSDQLNNGGATIWGTVNGDLRFATIPSGATHPATGTQYPTDSEVKNYTSMVMKWNPYLSNTQVQIGKQGPDPQSPHLDYRLSVDGKILAKEIYVTASNWADYVFDDGYVLMPMDSLRSFIQQHHHLPNVPTTEEVLTNGNNTGETDRILLEKVEELTLYVLQLEKELRELKEKTLPPAAR